MEDSVTDWFVAPSGGMPPSPEPKQTALAAYALPAPITTIQPIVMGNINETYVVHDAAGTRYILQRLNPIFKPEIHYDIDVVTEMLARTGLTTPRLIRTQAGTLWTEVCDNGPGVWRLQTFIDGEVHSRAARPAQCEAAAHLLGRFHHALDPLQGHRFRAPRLGVHDTARHLQALRDALQAHPEHVAFRAVQPLAHAILTAAAALPPMRGLPARVVHGDPKLNNVIFTSQGQAVALIDLDTLNSMPITLELGDALRSWCNPAGEDAPAAHFSIDHFKATLQGYAAGAAGMLNRDEITLLPVAMQTIALELAARFARDALEESYFGWDRQRYSQSWEHQLIRARSQFSLAESYARQRAEASAWVSRLFGQ